MSQNKPEQPPSVFDFPAGSRKRQNLYIRKHVLAEATAVADQRYHISLSQLADALLEREVKSKRGRLRLRAS